MTTDKLLPDSDLRTQLRTYKGAHDLTNAELGAGEVSHGHLSAFLRGKTDLSVSRLERMLERHGLRLELVPIEPSDPAPAP